MTRLAYSFNCYQLGELTDAQSLTQHVRLARHAVAAGLRGLFVYEHHFSGYILSPSPLDLAVYLYSTCQADFVGTSVLILPHYDIDRLVERIAQADILVQGNLLIGVGTGRSSYELANLGSPRPTALEFAQLVGRLQDALTSGYSRDREVPLRPKPDFNPSARLYLAASHDLHASVGAQLGRMAILGSDTAIHPKQVIFAPLTIANTEAQAIESADRAEAADHAMADAHYGRPHSARRREANPLLSARHIFGTPSQVARKIAGLVTTFKPQVLALEPALGQRRPEEVIHIFDQFQQKVLPNLRALGIT